MLVCHRLFTDLVQNNFSFTHSLLKVYFLYFTAVHFHWRSKTSNWYEPLFKLLLHTVT